MGAARRTPRCRPCAVVDPAADARDAQRPKGSVVATVVHGWRPGDAAAGGAMTCECNVEADGAVATFLRTTEVQQDALDMPPDVAASRLDAPAWQLVARCVNKLCAALNHADDGAIPDATIDLESV